MSLDITHFMREEYKLLRSQCVALCSSPIGQMRRTAESLLPSLTAHTLAEEEVLLSKASEIDALRPIALKALEAHEVSENELVRLWQSVDEEQFSARVGVVCDLLTYQWKETEEKLIPALEAVTTAEERIEMAFRYRELKERHRISSILRMPDRSSRVKCQAGRISYLFAWLVGIPAWLLFMIFLTRT